MSLHSFYSLVVLQQNTHSLAAFTSSFYNSSRFVNKNRKRELSMKYSLFIFYILYYMGDKLLYATQLIFLFINGFTIETSSVVIHYDVHFLRSTINFFTFLTSTFFFDYFPFGSRIFPLGLEFLPWPSKF